MDEPGCLQAAEFTVKAPVVALLTLDVRGVSRWSGVCVNFYYDANNSHLRSKHALRDVRLGAWVLFLGRIQSTFCSEGLSLALNGPE